ncbi:MAG: hypothetical protein NT030_07670, partial [Candidatus Saganbacteria bacterium]|nr:hypothetical protein [Candidatus Saganbacteria bacterium]
MDKKLIETLITIFLFCFLFRGISYGAGIARPLGMGGAFIGAADDVNAVFYNSAGICFLEEKEFE